MAKVVFESICWSLGKSGPGVLGSSGSIGEVGIRGCGCSFVEFPFSHFEQVIELGIVREVDWKQLGSMGHQRHKDMSSLFSKDAG